MKLMSGSKFPKHTGADFAGIVEEVGSGVSHLKMGDAVFGVVKNLMKEGMPGFGGGSGEALLSGWNTSSAVPLPTGGPDFRTVVCHL